MKMSDHFEQDLKACDITNGLEDTKFGLVDSYGIATSKIQMVAAAHAIDHHDALVAMNKELVEALTNLINDIGSKHSIHIENNIGGSTRRALNCAKIVLANSEELNHER
jgi:ribosomal protein S13